MTIFMDKKLEKAVEKFYLTPITRRLYDKGDFDSLNKLWIELFYETEAPLPEVYFEGDRVIIAS